MAYTKIIEICHMWFNKEREERRGKKIGGRRRKEGEGHRKKVLRREKN